MSVNELSVGHGSNVNTPIKNLRQWLGRSFWYLDRNKLSLGGYSQAVWLIAGLDPESTKECSQAIDNETTEWEFKFLPNGLNSLGFKDYPTSRLEHTTLEIRVFETLEFFNEIPEIRSRNPTKIIAHILEYEHEIPWLEFAKNDKECAKFLPTTCYEDNRGITTLTEHQSRAGKKKATSCPRRIAQIPVAYIEWRKWQKDESLYKNKSELAERLYDLFVSDHKKFGNPFEMETIRDWLWKLFEKLDSDKGDLPEKYTL